MEKIVRRNPYGINVSFKLENDNILISHPFYCDKYISLTNFIENYNITQMEFDFFRKSVNEMGYRIVLKPKIEKK